MRTFLLGACFFLLSTYFTTSFGETKVFRSKRSFNGQSSKETFVMFIKEQGSKFKETVRFDFAKKTVTYHVPAHRDLLKADFMVDFDFNITVTRLPENEFCYIQSRSPGEPSMDLLRKSMSKVSSGKYKVRNGSRVFSHKLMSTGLADRSKLSKNVLEFCGGLPIYDMKTMEHEQDSVAVSKGIIRRKRQRQSALPFCKRLEDYDLESCRSKDQDYATTCKFSVGDCVYWVECPGGLDDIGERNGYCTSDHHYNNAMCCDLSCPQ